MYRSLEKLPYDMTFLKNGGLNMATKKFDRAVWHGTDCDKVTSLFEYGLLVRYITKEKSWQCIYRNPHESNKFSYSWISEEDMREMFLTGWAKDDLKSFLFLCR